MENVGSQKESQGQTNLCREKSVPVHGARHVCRNQGEENVPCPRSCVKSTDGVDDIETKHNGHLHRF